MALIVHISAAAAANPLNDRADEQRAWLSSESATVSAPVSATRSSKVARSTGDAQQQAREMLLAMHAEIPSGPAVASDKTEPQERAVPHSDMQTAVR
jgi:hypothetical protein